MNSFIRTVFRMAFSLHLYKQKKNFINLSKGNDVISKIVLISSLSIILTTANAMENPCPQVSVQTGQNKIIKSKGHPFKVSILKKETAELIYNHIANMQDIPYKYVVDGCDVRAYLAAKEISEKWKIESFRANLESYPNMIAKTPFTAEGWVDFSKHSALALCVYDSSENIVKPMVVDVAFSSGLKDITSWKESVTDEFSDKEPELFFSGMYNLNPEGRNKKKFSASELRCAEEVREAFMREQQKIENGQLPYGVGRSKEVLRLNMCL